MAYRQASTKAAVTYSLNTSLYGGDATITVVGALDTGEVISFKCPADNSNAAETDLYVEGQKVEITPTNSMVRITGNTIVTIRKGVTADEVGFRIA